MPNSTTIILPVFNEEGNLRPLVEELSDTFGETEYSPDYLFVDDASTDDSRKVLQNLSSKHNPIEVLSLSEHTGKSAALAAGFNQADSSLIATMDSDGQDRPADLLAMLGEIDDCDGIAGYRKNRADGWWRKLSSKIANEKRKSFLDDNIRDSACGLRLFRNKVIEALPRFEGMHRFLPSLALINGFDIKQMPVQQRPRKSGASAYSNIGRLPSTFRDLIGVTWLKQRHIDFNVVETINEETESSDEANSFTKR
ncbi:MAG: glycosyltransferase family 2 protein [bacterium]